MSAKHVFASSNLACRSMENNDREEALKRAKTITDKPHLSNEDRVYIQGFADAILITKKNAS